MDVPEENSIESLFGSLLDKKIHSNFKGDY